MGELTPAVNRSGRRGSRGSGKTLREHRDTPIFATPSLLDTVRADEGGHAEATTQMSSECRKALGRDGW